MDFDDEEGQTSGVTRVLVGETRVFRVIIIDWVVGGGSGCDEEDRLVRSGGGGDNNKADDD